MAQVGSPVVFSFGTAAGVSATQFTGKILIQSLDHSPTADEEQTRDGTGKLVARNFYNPGDKLGLEYIVTDTTLSAAKGYSCPTPGVFINITQCDDVSGVSKANWVVVSEPKQALSNTGAKRVTLQLEAHAGITTYPS